MVVTSVKVRGRLAQKMQQKQTDGRTRPILLLYQLSRSLRSTFSLTVHFSELNEGVGGMCLVMAR